MKLALHLVTWNGAKYIPYLFYSLSQQTAKDWQFYILDNGSTDETVALIKAAAEKFGLKYNLTQNQTNLGFAAGHNRLFQESVADQVVILNQDLYLLEDCVAALSAAIDHAPEIGAVAPMLLHWQFPAGMTRVIDAMGLRVGRQRRVIEWQRGEEWSREMTVGLAEANLSRLRNLCGRHALEVFGVSGALAIFQRRALDKIAGQNGQIFDVGFGSYKEDVDLAWRLRSGGYQAFVLLDALAYHERSVAAGSELSDRAAAARKRTQALVIQHQSYRNHLITLYKNEYGQNFLLDLPWILWYELKKFFFFLIFRPTVLRGLGELWQRRHELRAARGEIRAKRRAGWREMRRWWN